MEGETEKCKQSPNVGFRRLSQSAPQIELHTDIGHFSMEMSRMGKRSELWHDQQTKGQVKTEDSRP